MTLGATVLFINSQTKKYTGTAVLLFKPLLLDAQLAGIPLQVPSSDPTVEAATDVGLVSLPQVRIEAARILGPPYTANGLKHAVSASAQGKSTLVDVKGTARTPEAAAAVANAMATAFIDVRRRTLDARINSALASLQHDLKTGGNSVLQKAVLRNNLTKLAETRSVQPSDVELAGLAVPPTSPSSPKKALDLIIGGALGLVLGIALAILAEQLDRRVRRPEDVGDALDLPVLAKIPRSKELKRSDGFAHALSASDVEAFRSLRANLRYRSGGREIRSVLLTSAAPGSGKTTVSLYLAAAAAAAMEGNVLLVEADLRRPRLAALLSLRPDRGLSTALRTSEALADAVESVPAGHGGNGDAPDHNTSFTENFDVLAAGPQTSRASELLGSEHMTRLLESAEESYELTIVDGPPPGLVSDVIPLMKQVDAVVLVARLGRENSPELRRLRDQLKGLGVEPLGVVANFSRRTSNRYVTATSRD